MLLKPPDDYPASVCQISAVPPFLAEYCQRKHQKRVLAVSFYVTILNDQNYQTLSPSFPLELGMDILLKERSLNHLKKIQQKGFPMSEQFTQLAGGHVSTAPQSEGEWDPPPLRVEFAGSTTPQCSRSSIQAWIQATRQIQRGKFQREQ
jgi:hypothetical protein